MEFLDREGCVCLLAFNLMIWLEDKGHVYSSPKKVLYTMGGLENLQSAKKYYASAINLTGGKNTRALYGVCLCSVAISQLTKGRNKEEESSELQSLAAEALLKDYKQRAPGKLPLLTTTLRNMKLIS